MLGLKGCRKSCCCCIAAKSSSDSETPWTLADQPPLSMGFSRQEHWSGLPCPPPRDLSDPGMKPMSPALAGGFLTIYLLGKPAGRAQKRIKVQSWKEGKKLS